MKREYVAHIFAILAPVVIIGCVVGTPVPTSEPRASRATQETPSTVGVPQSGSLINNDPAGLNFSALNIPTGWRVHEKAYEDGGYRVRVVKLGEVIRHPESIVDSWVGVFANIEGAQAAYVEQRHAKAERFALSDPGIGQESFAYAGDGQIEVHYREANVLARVTMYSEYGASLEDAEEWAQKLEAKMDRVKSFVPVAITEKSTIPTDTASPAMIQQSQQLIINDPSELNFSILDFPVGWQIESKGESSDGYHFRAIKLGSVIRDPEKVVVSWARVFPSIEAASKDYHQQRKEKAETFPLDNPGIGDESFVYEGNATDEVYFRIRNILVRVTMYTQYGGSLKNAKQWAEKLEAKIDQVKSLGASLPLTLPFPTQSPPEIAPTIATTTSTPTSVTSARPTPTPAPTLNPSLTALATLPPVPTITAVASERCTVSYPRRQVLSSC